MFEEAGCAEASVTTGTENEVAQKVYVDAGLNEACVSLEKHFTPKSLSLRLRVTFARAHGDHPPAGTHQPLGT